MKKRMNILFIARWFPCPQDNGSRIRTFSLLKGLAENHKITLISFTQQAPSHEDLQQVRELCEPIYTFPFKEFNANSFKSILGFFSPTPRSVKDTHSPAMARQVLDTCQQQNFDLVLASEMGAVPYALLAHGSFRVWDDVELASFRDQFLKQRNPLFRLRYALTWWKICGYVRRTLSSFDGCTVVSEQERAILTEVVPTYRKVELVPNGVDLDSKSGDFGPSERDTLIYPGSLTYDANLDAMEFFLEKIFPLIRSSHPSAELKITGNHEGVPLNPSFSEEGVNLTGYLKNIKEAVAESWVCVVPLRKGAGTRLKILEAMALGTPVVSTKKGAEGIDVTHEKNILIADEPRLFADAVNRLLEDEQLRQQLSLNGRRLVEERYGWDQCAARLVGFVEGIASDREAQVRT